MSARSLSPTRRQLLAATAGAGALSLLSATMRAAAADDAVRPFRVDIPQEQLTGLRRRLAATRWPDQETVPDQSQGAQLAKLQELVRYWGTEYDWRKGEARLNAFPQ
ncbi:MAG: epoxide hydrolase N-terminal domain-containing protein, partial [Methylobacteriaceae bacterium]|nr:epoxide hydrolase N-terminal domain-containing protein [Methylobacteriaceae bacterium]